MAESTRIVTFAIIALLRKMTRIVSYATFLTNPGPVTDSWRFNPRSSHLPRFRHFSRFFHLPRFRHFLGFLSLPE